MRKLKQMLLVCVMGVMVFALSGCGSTTIDLNKYVTIEVEGYDSMGTLNCTFDSEAFEKDYNGKIKANVKSNDGGTAAEIALELGFGAEVVDVFLDYCVNYQLDKRSELSNGDVVNLKWNCEDEDAKKYFNVKLKYSDIKYTVKGLTEVGTFNPFDYVSVSFSGISPNGSMTITPNYDQPEIQYVSFFADKNSGLKVGDSVEVSASISGSVDSFVERFGCVLGKTEETYTVDALSRYIANIEDVPEEMYNKMNKQLQDCFNAHVASSFDPEESASITKFIGNYLCTLKDGMTGKPNNYLYYVYQISYSNSETEISDYSYYWYGYFNDIMILADGTCTVDLSDYTVSEYSSSWWEGTKGEYVTVPPDGAYIVAGFADLDSFFNQHIVSKIEKYEYTQTIQ